MKSIMEEASSISKAIEKGWARAGKPQEFTVKVFEEAQKNFFGFTSKPAKIGLFFQEQQVHHIPKTHKEGVRTTQNKKYSAHTQSQPAKPQSSHAHQQQRSASHSTYRQEKTPFSEQQPTAPWSPELVQAAEEWVKDSLQLMNIGAAQVSTTTDRYALKLVFSKPVLESIEKEKMLFRSWAYLIMQALRQKFKRPLKGLKVILTSIA